MNASKSQLNVLWLQVWGLAALQGAITLSWVIYNAYLPKLLGEFGFPAQLAAGLLVVENALAVVMEPLMGGLSDNSYRWFGSRFAFISAGVILSSALFIAIPCVVIFGNSYRWMSWVLPGVAIAWALAMTIFRSPAISLLGRYAAPAQLPLAASLLTLTGGIIGSFRGIANNFILSLGPVITFAIGSFVLLGAAAALRYVNPPSAAQEIPQSKIQNPKSKISLQALGLILVTGAGVAWGSRLLMDAIGKVLKIHLPSANIPLLILVISIVMAFAALPAGAIALRLGNRRAMLIGLAATVPLLLMMVFIPSLAIAVAAIIGAIASFSLIVNGTIPFALSLVPADKGGLGVGMYFGGFSGAMSLFGLVFQQPAAITPVTGGIVGAIAFIVAALGIAASLRLCSPHQPLEQTNCNN